MDNKYVNNIVSFIKKGCNAKLDIYMPVVLIVSLSLFFAFFFGWANDVDDNKYYIRTCLLLIPMFIAAPFAHKRAVMTNSYINQTAVLMIMSWVLQYELVCVAAITYFKCYGFDWVLPLIPIIPLVIYICHAVYVHRSLKLEEVKHKRISPIIIELASGLGGTGILLGRLIGNNMSVEDKHVLLIVTFSLSAILLSFTSILPLKLIYVKQLKKNGIDISELQNEIP